LTGWRWSLAALGLAVSLWYVILPAAALLDAAFLALIGWVTLGRYFDRIYPRLFGQHLETLGAIGLLHVVALTLMLQRPIGETGYGFWPNQREWIIGARHYLFFLLVGGPLALALRTAHLAAFRLHCGSSSAPSSAGARLALRPGAQPGRQHPRQYGDARLVATTWRAFFA
jgi:hypothetical protein